MTTLTKDHNNHPAHAPLTTRRLHQMRDILSKAAAQRDGGDIGYAMSDAVKLIDEVLAMKSAPLMFIDGNLSPEDAEKLIAAIDEFNREPRNAQVMIAEPVSEPNKLNGAQFKPVSDLYEISIPGAREVHFTTDAKEAYECRIAGWGVQEFVKLERLQDVMTGNSPVIPDGWIKCSDRMPDEIDLKNVQKIDENIVAVPVLVCMSNGNTVTHASYFIPGSKYGNGFSFCEDDYLLEGEPVEYWMPMPAAPRQEVK